MIGSGHRLACYLGGCHGRRPRPRGSAAVTSAVNVIDFERINRAALVYFPAVLRRLLPNGKAIGSEFVALNPTRRDRRPGSFKVNLRTGRWSDFATGDKGGDPISLVAYIAGVSQGEAARLLARMLGVEVGAPRRG
jgi:hypothetical protein